MCVCEWEGTGQLMSNSCSPFMFSEIIRYFKAKTPEKTKIAPHLSNIVQHFNRVSVFIVVCTSL